jgi:hypothetical protein
MRRWFRRARGAALCAAAIAAAQPAAAQETRVFTLKALMELCRANDATRQQACAGYVTGVRHTLGIFKNTLKDRLALCIPNTVNNKDFKDGFMAWAEKNPGEFERSAVSGVIKSAFARYRCGAAPGGEKPFEF